MNISLVYTDVEKHLIVFGQILREDDFQLEAGIKLQMARYTYQNLIIKFLKPQIIAKVDLRLGVYTVYILIARFESACAGVEKYTNTLISAV